MSADDNKFLQELRSAYDNILKQRNHLDNKAATMLTASSTVTSLLFGFGIFIFTRIDPSYQFLLHASILLAMAIVLNIGSVLVSVLAFRTENYRYVNTSTRFFEKGEYTEEEIKKAKNYNEVEIEYFKDMNTRKFEDILVHDYLSCNHLNSLYNFRKASKVTIAQILLLTGIGILPFIALILFHAAAANALHITEPII